MVTESPRAPIEIPDVDIWGMLFEKDIEFPEDKVIYVDPQTKRQLTFLDVKNTSIAFGNALRTQWGWQKGDVFSSCAVNSIDTPALTFGTLWANGVVSPANPAYTSKEFAFQLKDSGAKAILTQAPLLETVLEAARLAGIHQSRILLIGDEKDDRVAHYTDFIKSSGPWDGVKRNKQSASDLALIPYSSGTTGLPKGVMLTQRNIVVNLLQMDIGELSWNGGPDGQGDTILAVLPFYHVYGLVLLVHHTIHCGVKTIVLPGFVPELFLRSIQEYKVTQAYLVPPIILFLAKHPIVDKFNLSSVTSIMSAAAPLSAELVNALYNRLKIPIRQAYGLSESSPGTHIQATSEWKTHIGSVGTLLANIKAKYVSEAGEELPAGSVGELWLKGPNIFAGYWKNPTATANCMTSDGYFKTGDIGFQDKEGHFYITDRLKELIKYKGFQVAPAELEGLLLGNENVADVCVIGMYDDSQATEIPLAFVVKEPSAQNVDDKTLEADIRGWVDGQVANHKKLRGGVRFVSEIPKSAAGKILRRVLRDQVSAEQKQLKSKL